MYKMTINDRWSPSTRQIFIALVLLVPSGLVLAIHMYLGSYTRLLADDFCSIYFARRLNMLRYMWYWYLNWGGRYSAIATDSFIETIGANGVRFVPFFVLLVWVIVMSAALHQALQKEVSRDRSLFTSLSVGIVFLFVLLSVSPKVHQVLYWWNAMRTYIPALISLTFHLGFLYWLSGKQVTGKQVLLGSLFSFLIALFSGGYNETFTAIQFLFFMEVIVLGMLTKRIRLADPNFYFLAAAILGSVLSLGIMLMSPGTANRQGFFTPSPDILTTFNITLDGYLQYITGIFSTPEKISALIGLALTATWIGTETKEKSSHGWLIPATLASGILLSFASLVPAAHGTSEMPAPRTFIVPTFTIVVSLFYAGLLTGKWLAGRTVITKQINSGLMLFVAASMLFSSLMVAGMLYKDRETYIGFSQRWDQSNAQIIQAKLNGEESVTIPAPKNWAGLEEINDNPKYWVTQCYTLYYDFPVFGPNPDLESP
jgi:hypothetical protein